MSDLTTALDKSDLEHLAERFRAGVPCSVQNLPISAQAFLAWSLAESTHRPWIWVVDSPRTLETLFRDALALAPGREGRLTCFPAWDAFPNPSAGAPAPDADLSGQRLRCLLACSQPAPPALILTCVQALMQRTLSPRDLRTLTLILTLAQEYDFDALPARLQQLGYELTAEVQAKRQAAVRGGLLDIWPATEPWPVRLEFFGDVIDSIRAFDPYTQTSVGRLTQLSVPPADESVAFSAGARSCALTEHLPREAGWAYVEPERLRESAEHYEELAERAGARLVTCRFATLRQRIRRDFSGGQLLFGADGNPDCPLPFRPCEGLPALDALRMEAARPFAPDLLERARRDFVRDLGRRAAEGWDVHFFLDAPGSRERFEEQFQGEPGLERFALHVAPLSEGFVYEPRRLIVVAESDPYGFRKQRLARPDVYAGRPVPSRIAGPPLEAWTDLQPGDLVVHADHGIGKYLGLYEIAFDGQLQEVLAIEYRDQARLYVPVSQIQLLTKYVGIGKRRPDLHALGGRRWLREKVGAERAVRDLAASLLEIQAAREALPGHAFPPDTPWQHEFEAAFPYEETPDQQRAIEDVKQDMQSTRPMDRLICGDVGYGKTEVAMRAAFKAVMDDRQVAVLVPTTVLAQQHFDTFTERMAAFPITIEMLSRFRSRKEQADIVRRLREGAVDIVIGTHRLVQPDVAFKDLGLVIIDEEQRFGVRHKEHLKQLRRLVDVLTLTATPIPRTLYLSLTGARDMSTIQTPPQERLAIQTIVTEYREEVVRDAILRELNRGGQVFYLHNRVQTIQRVAERLAALVPEARIAVAHGQMSEKTLSSVMHRFVRGEMDLLLCTTIIESGVDIPNVNTILIDRADRFGMADLYQLRGRVGRYKHQAYAYLLLPRHGRLFDSARKRISAIKRYSSLGAGFKLALRDLEIRGAGNLLGRQQSGHIAAVGFDLYCQLLKRTIARMKGEPVPPLAEVPMKLDFLDLSPQRADAPNAATIPYRYIEDENLRLEIYRKIAQCAAEPELDRLQEELRDRFGPLPDAVERLLRVARLRIVASLHNLQAVEVREDKLMLTRGGDYLMKDRRFPRLRASDPTARLDEILQIVRTWDGA